MDQCDSQFWIHGLPVLAGNPDDKWRICHIRLGNKTLGIKAKFIRLFWTSPNVKSVNMRRMCVKKCAPVLKDLSLSSENKKDFCVRWLYCLSFNTASLYPFEFITNSSVCWGPLLSQRTSLQILPSRCWYCRLSRGWRGKPWDDVKLYPSTDLTSLELNKKKHHSLTLSNNQTSWRTLSWRIITASL